jgi:hypothetical protein
MSTIDALSNDRKQVQIRNSKLGHTTSRHQIGLKSLICRKTLRFTVRECQSMWIIGPFAVFQKMRRVYLDEFRRRVKTQGSLPSQDAVMLLLFGLLRSGRIKLRALVGYHEMGKVAERSAA